MVKTTYDRTARRHKATDNREGPAPVALLLEVFDVRSGEETLPAAACRLQRVHMTPYVLGEAEPRLDRGLGQLLDPSRNRSIIGTGVFCAEYCAIHPAWSWEAL
jgi:hypothetical protein